MLVHCLPTEYLEAKVHIMMRRIAVAALLNQYAGEGGLVDKAGIQRVRQV